ncbi:MAG: hypothetical protein DYG94_04250 [Leptolyngbya sp. PLA3]|nr:MAG: hypothetical protein EDM82_07645 [Cyanobacteria bacterium CYA]MCE7967943.1 hypothetical protein [Leptolyngbya sp. PL-A3]
MTIPTEARLWLALLLVLPLSACYNRSLADRNTIARTGQIATLTGNPAPDVPTQVAPSVHSLSRLEWQPIDVIVPVDGTVHGPQRRIDLRYLSTGPRHRFLFPTVDSALDLSADRRGRRIEAAAAPFVGLLNVFTMPINLFRDPPGSYMSPSKAMLYKRSRPGATLAGVIPQLDPAPAQAPPLDP